MTHNEIRAELIRRGITCTSIAKQLGTALPNVSLVLAGKKKTKRIRAAIAAAIDRDEREVFDDQVAV